MMNNLLYDGKARLAELLTAHPNLLMALSRFGISLGFADKSIEEVCKESGVDCNFFCLICNVYAFDDYAPSIETIANTDMSGIVAYLENSHQYYLEMRLPHIEYHLGVIAERLNTPRMRDAFKNFFKVYRTEIESHFHYEEKHVFPHISRLQNGVKESPYKINDFISSHGNLQDKLDDLTQIIVKYLPMGASDDIVDVVFDILQLSQDLKKHNLIEEKIMVPYVTLIEKNVK